MNHSNYESVEINPITPIKAFAASIKYSNFHWHEVYEIIGVLRGSVILNIGSRNIQLKKGDLYLINPNEIHEIQGASDENNICMLVQLDPALFLNREEKHQIHFYLNSQDKDLYPTNGIDIYYKRVANIVFNSMSDKRTAPFRIRAEVSVLVADLMEYAVYDIKYKDPIGKSDIEQVINIIDFFKKNLSEEKLADGACHNYGVSRKTMDRLMKNITGISVKDMIMSIRIDEAMKLLRETDSNMNYIIDMCGFGSENTFYRIFKMETGMTPKQYREELPDRGYSEEIKGYVSFEDIEVREMLGKIIKD